MEKRSTLPSASTERTSFRDVVPFAYGAAGMVIKTSHHHIEIPIRVLNKPEVVSREEWEMRLAAHLDSLSAELRDMDKLLQGVDRAELPPDHQSYLENMQKLVQTGRAYLIGEASIQELFLACWERKDTKPSF